MHPRKKSAKKKPAPALDQPYYDALIALMKAKRRHKLGLIDDAALAEAKEAALTIRRATRQARFTLSNETRALESILDDR